MNIGLIESTLNTTRKLHPDLDEKMLRTLLLSSGWDEGDIRDSVTLLKSTPPSPTINSKEPVNNIEVLSKSIIDNGIAKAQAITDGGIVYIRPDGSEENLAKDAQVSTLETPLRDVVKDKVVKGENHSVLTQGLPITDEQVTTVEQQKSEVMANQIAQTVTVELNSKIQDTNIAEPQSLINHSEVHLIKGVTSFPPDNLPLKPFETSPQVWQFSKYRDVFYGEVLDPITVEEEKLVEPDVVPLVTVKKTPLTTKDEMLAIVAGGMLLIVMLLLGYMYGNNRF